MITIRVLGVKGIETPLVVGLALMQLKNYKIKTSNYENKDPESVTSFSIESSQSANLLIFLTNGKAGAEEVKFSLDPEIVETGYEDSLILNCEKEITQFSSDKVAEWIQHKVIEIESKTCSVWEEF